MNETALFRRVLPFAIIHGFFAWLTQMISALLSVQTHQVYSKTLFHGAG